MKLYFIVVNTVLLALCISFAIYIFYTRESLLSHDIETYVTSVETVQNNIDSVQSVSILNLNQKKQLKNTGYTLLYKDDNPVKVYTSQDTLVFTDSNTQDLNVLDTRNTFVCSMTQYVCESHMRNSLSGDSALYTVAAQGNETYRITIHQNSITKNQYLNGTLSLFFVNVLQQP